MTNGAFVSLENFRDVESLNAYQELTESGAVAPEDMLRYLRYKSRDNARTPMQWDAGEHAGFSTTTPWLRPTGQAEVSVAAEEENGRVLPYYRRLVALRKALPVISEGRYDPWELEHPSVFAYLRTLEGEDVEGVEAGVTSLFVATSFSGEPTRISIPDGFAGGRILIANTRDSGSIVSLPDDGSLTLAPYEALVLLPAGVELPEV